MSVGTDARTPAWLDGAARHRLAARIEAALRSARTGGAARLVSVTSELAGLADPAAIVVASRAAGEAWQVLEQPDRDGHALAALGSVIAIEAAGPRRFQEIAATWRSLAARALADPAPPVPGGGLVAAGGFAFAPAGGAGPQWRGFAPASLVVPELALARRAGRTWITVSALAQPDDTPQDVQARVERRLATLRRADALPLLDPSPTGRFEVVSAMPPSHFEQAVAHATQRIARGEVSKVVLAREVQVHAPADHDPGAVLGILREAFASCYVYAVGRGDAVFVGASPELLIRREGQRASTVALAGSTRRSADPAIDDHLGEQLLRSDKDREENAIVARRIVRALHDHAVWVAAAPEPSLVKVANIQHLGLPIRAQLARPLDAIELAALLHPTPAVGGEPSAAAQALIPALEGFDRGWYAGGLGWVDANGDGELCVALRCALLRGRLAHCYAGCGIVTGSDPEAELAESEVKLGAILPLLAG